MVATYDLCDAVEAIYASPQLTAILKELNIDRDALDPGSAEDLQRRIGPLIARLDAIDNSLAVILSEQAKTQARLINNHKRFALSRSLSMRDRFCRWVSFMGLCNPPLSPRQSIDARLRTLENALGQVVVELETALESFSSDDTTAHGSGSSGDTSVQFGISNILKDAVRIGDVANAVVREVYLKSVDGTVNEEVQNMLAPVGSYSRLFREVFESVKRRKAAMSSTLVKYVQALERVTKRTSKLINRLSQAGGDNDWELEDLREQMGDALDEWVKAGETLSL
ncbi:hypothetical protein NM208_g16896 [Fusarium decemcellulare]|uniref:Uncharacterized protein n=1 Tax=Fusarium decemcellulare TaxID=57161 RepID=A0ACC1RAT1_9HYPO|nr:hypothetical protein NM208_g16896 [Fusarium decemcellulare]